MSGRAVDKENLRLDEAERRAAGGAAAELARRAAWPAKARKAL